MKSYEEITLKNGVPIKSWTRGVLLDEKAREQLIKTASLPFIHKWLAVMPDVHWGLGATIGSVIPTKKAIIPAAVGVDIGCGMVALKTSLKAEDLPDDLREMRLNIERAIPHGKSGRGRDKGAWHDLPKVQIMAWEGLLPGYEKIVTSHPVIDQRVNHNVHLGTLGGGNHFVEVCLDENSFVWFMLHSGSRGVGNRIGRHFIQLAKEDMGRHIKDLPDKDLAYFEEGAEHFDDYVHAVMWAQKYARINRDLMMNALVKAVASTKRIPPFQALKKAINCHHNYVALETHYGEEVYITRKGAVRAGEGDLGIIPGSMGAKSFIVRGKGNAQSFHSCSHGAGRTMSRTQARKTFSIKDHERDTRGVECRKDEKVIDETPKAYKPIEKVMKAQEDLVEIVATLKQVVCVKG